MESIIHPTRSNLLLLRERTRSFTNSCGLLKARRQALIREFLATSRPFLRSREELRQSYGTAIEELQLAGGTDGERILLSVVAACGRELGVDVVERSIMGLRYLDLIMPENPGRGVEERGYDYRQTSPHTEEAIDLFERIVAAMLAVAAFESKLKRLGDEIVRLTRRLRVLEERLLPELRHEVKKIAQYLGERDREAYYRLKRFKERGEGK